ncbi:MULTISPECIES: hypothetical protein [Chryseobacterium group]|uniref:Nitrogen regulatory IIA protein n=2 Tax=Chryseobacterium TaxID=59732 RepID=A0AAD1DPM5_CHRNA|nr:MULTISPECIES: hypothetical protein [Chryseobacterium group]AZA89811.1 hypothetical protein EG343_03805 [Chryseobacterium nakagawai]SEQ91893.1 hypothetical protein SAMN04488097_3366 [Epilithonimonas lactis]SMP12117.1 hypothetical protein SAMN06264346_102417 [Chryseobacterium profundimaris]VEH21213.1 Uncharacterised protein [Chryseobacterium nakagawai]
MKKIRDIIERHVLKADQKWKALPTVQQRLMTKLFFGCYVVLTVAVLVSIAISTGNKNNTISISHITTFSDRVDVGNTANDNRTNAPIKR